MVVRSLSYQHGVGSCQAPTALWAQPVAVMGLEGGLGSSMMSKTGVRAPTGSAPMLVHGAAVLPGAQVQDANRNYSIWQ